ncbi:MAG TPA: CAP domain-containing protein [Allosphingosinicella sp.]|nr:CAP domain-containing protein [Allosphingosinicella sp.]
MAAGLAGLATPPAAAQPGAAPAAAASPKLDDFATRILAAHNRYRAAVGVPALRWDTRLAAAARRYAPKLAAFGSLVHSPREDRPGQRENLWRGRAGSSGPEAMVDYWASGRRSFRPGIFPNVSTTGNSNDVSHYTQIIWRGTTDVGCALHRSPRWDYLICRYAPPGNVDGQRVP